MSSLSPRGNAKGANIWREVDLFCILAAGNGQVLSPVTNRARVQKQTGTKLYRSHACVL